MISMNDYLWKHWTHIYVHLCNTKITWKINLTKKEIVLRYKMSCCFKVKWTFDDTYRRVINIVLVSILKCKYLLNFTIFLLQRCLWSKTNFQCITDKCLKDWMQPWTRKILLCIVNMIFMFFMWSFCIWICTFMYIRLPTTVGAYVAYEWVVC